MCNAWNHPVGCHCGFGGDTSSSHIRLCWRYRDEDFCHSTSCPACGAPVYFVRHNGGSVWFDELGPPWDKHGCFADEDVGSALRIRLIGDSAGPRPPVFGIVLETDAAFGEKWGRVIVRCSNGTILDRLMPFADIPVGQVVLVREVGGEVLLEMLTSSPPTPSGGTGAT